MSSRLISEWQLKQRQSLPFEVKIQLSLLRIRDWYDAWRGHVYVSFSGGMDSTVLLHLVRNVYPHVPAVFVNDLPYPEVLAHIRATENVTIIRPKKRFPQVIRQYGYPVVSKRVAQYVHEVQASKACTPTRRLRMTGIASDGKFRKLGMIPHKWQYLINAPFKISDRCCHWLKKKPLREGNRFGYPYIGLRVGESNQRKLGYLHLGCNAFDIKHPRSTPLAFWSDADIWEYVRMYNLPYSELYDMGYERSGCFACMFGAHLESPNRFQRMRATHPKLWRYCEGLGIPEVLDYIGVPYETTQAPLFEIAASGRLILQGEMKA